MPQDHAVTSRFTVRSYEVDSYAHLNNGVYLSWFEQGRLDWLRSKGFSYDGFAERKQWFVVARTEVDFRRALLTGDEVLMTTRLEGLGRTSVRYRQVITAVGDDAPACEAFTIMAFTDNTRAVPIPDDFRAAAEG